MLQKTMLSQQQQQHQQHHFECCPSQCHCQMALDAAAIWIDQKLITKDQKPPDTDDIDDSDDISDKLRQRICSNCSNCRIFRTMLIAHFRYNEEGIIWRQYDESPFTSKSAQS